ncbi:MAG: hypothetical protein ACI8RD_003285 [Bacillariaceae sp.]|jgi:hypothetical protein
MKDERPIIITTIESPFRVIDVNTVVHGRAFADIVASNEVIGRKIWVISYKVQKLM